MTKPMKYRELAPKLREAGFVSRQGKGDHEVWSHGAIQVSITQTREVSPGLTAKALKAIERSKHA
ncbi:type II toxin-antitoxin system HicA family toxin [uncultured Tessaracoccus sp.]|uniref:type II toxin-antitoxin system HicA family toxin n=1 Tax=uncultured Tessaracoccus sp. TaxID=905023 RepID=UPI00345DA1C7